MFKVIWQPVVILLLFSMLNGAFGEYTAGTEVPIIFSSAVFSGGTCHRDDPDGCDLVSGMLNITTGNVTSVVALDTSPGTQWFPAVTPDGDVIVYESRAGRQNGLFLLIPDTMKRYRIADALRFPAFLDNKTTLIASTNNGTISVINLITNAIAPLQAGLSGFDPFPSGSIIAFHSRLHGNGPAIPGILYRDDDMERTFDCRGCGHPAISPDGTKIITCKSDEQSLMVSTFDPDTGDWGEFTPLLPDLIWKTRSMDPKWKLARELILSYPSFVDDTHILLTVQLAEPMDEGIKTTSAGLILVTIQNDVFSDTVLTSGSIHPLTLQLPDGTTYHGDSATAAVPLPFTSSPENNLIEIPQSGEVVMTWDSVSEVNNRQSK